MYKRQILDNNARPGFKGYNNFPNTLCVSVNNQVVHGIPCNKPLNNGDIISVDCGVIKDGYYGDLLIHSRLEMFQKKLKNC